ncbi:hypothetical protein LHFGNBLO_000104 [Mesorhizobium sp. AR10]|uniref:hypothetical protein n=1 Tax=Mesorhizobium sp. AR10 TaxID=2865839 RepID=UPI0021607F39|nr:hypothetical protein [Mesorhizobium sp. AR10]UVK38816.1 hypothetical protein LHFGNBLO_000104 [Mesorhizobium sp. AR10]
MTNQVPLQIKTRFALTRIKALGAAVSLVAISAMPVAAASPAATASGLPSCGSRPEILKQLSTRFNEAPVALGLAKNGSVIEVLTSDDGETWTILISQPNGPSCLVAVGEGWEELKRVGAKGERGA